MAYLSTGSLLEMGNLMELKALLVQNGWTWLTAVCTMLFITPALALLHNPHDHQKETQSWKWTGAAFLIPTLTGLLLCFRGQWRAAAGAGLTRKNRSPKYSFCQKPRCSKAVPGVLYHLWFCFLFQAALCPHPAFSVQGASFFKITSERTAARTDVPAKFSHIPVKPKGQKAPISSTGEYQRSRHGNEGRRKGLFRWPACSFCVAKESHRVI